MFVDTEREERGRAETDKVKNKGINKTDVSEAGLSQCR